MTLTVARSGGGAGATTRLRLPASWPVWAGVAAYPLWWALGVAHIILPILAVPAAVYLWQNRQATQRPIRVPPGFGLWLLFLLWVLISALALNQTAPGTLEPSGVGRFLSYGLRFAHYLAITTFMLYVGNMSERLLPRLSVIRAIGALCVGVVALGVLAIVFPDLAFRTPFSRIMPAGLGGEDGAVAALAQVQDLVSVAGARPAAPFAFTNTWGEVVSLTLVWLIVGWVMVGRGWRLVAGISVVALAIVPVIHSLNRGLWAALVLAAVYIAVRFALRGRITALAALAAVGAVLGALLLMTPLQTVVTERVDNPHSDQVRSWLSERAWEAAQASPVIGYGSTRDTVGSQQSIAVGQSPQCPQCGNRVVGSTGHLWLLLISQGLIGTALYVGYFLRTLWAYRRDHSVVGIAGSLVILLSLFYMYFYSALNVPLLIVMLSIALLWRNDDARGAASAIARASAGAARGRHP